MTKGKPFHWSFTKHQKRRQRFANLLGLWGLAVLMMFAGGCMKLGNDFTRPEMDFTIPEKWQHQQAPSCDHQPAAADEMNRWWQIFNDPGLNQLIEAVIANNHDIKKATAAIVEAEANLGITRAERMPTVNLSLEAGRMRKTRTTTLPGISRTTDSYTASLPASFEIDLWGRLARTEEAGRAQLLATETARETIINTVIAESVTLYLKCDAAIRRLQVARQRLTNRRKYQRLIQHRYATGLVNADALRQARIAVNQEESAVLAVKREIGGLQQQICVIAGAYPETNVSDTNPALGAINDQSPFTRLQPVRSGLPSSLLQNRPDIRTAEASLKALNATAGAAKAARFPRISLTGAFGYSNSELNDLLTPETEFWNIAAGITQPLFESGRLKAAHEAAQARYEKNVQEYAQTVLKAFAEVENGLFNRQHQIATRNRQVNTLLAARTAYHNAQSRYNAGVSTLNDVLSGEQILLDAQESLILTELSLLTNRVTLERALGGIFTPFPATGDDATNGTKSKE